LSGLGWWSTVKREEPASKPKPFVISKGVVWEAYKRVKANGGAAGVDQQSIAEFEQDLKGNLYKLWLCRAQNYAESVATRGRSKFKFRPSPANYSA